MDDETLARIADEARHKAYGANDPMTRAYAHGVEDLANLIAGDPQVSGRLVAILLGAGLRGMVLA